MPHVKCGIAAHARHQKIFALAEGYHGRRKNIYRAVKQVVMKADQYAYRDRRQRRRQSRQLWITRINAGTRENGLSCSKLMNGLERTSVGINCKVSVDLAILDKAAFAQLVEKAKATLAI